MYKIWIHFFIKLFINKTNLWASSALDTQKHLFWICISSIPSSLSNFWCFLYFIYAPFPFYSTTVNFSWMFSKFSWKLSNPFWLRITNLCLIYFYSIYLMRYKGPLKSYFFRVEDNFYFFSFWYYCINIGTILLFGWPFDNFVYYIS